MEFYFGRKPFRLLSWLEEKSHYENFILNNLFFAFCPSACATIVHLQVSPSWKPRRCKYLITLRKIRSQMCRHQMQSHLSLVIDICYTVMPVNHLFSPWIVPIVLLNVMLKFIMNLEHLFNMSTFLRLNPNITKLF